MIIGTMQQEYVLWKIFLTYRISPSSLWILLPIDRVYVVDIFEILTSTNLFNSIQLTNTNVDDFIKTNVDQGKTVYVRWIASPRWGWWKKQAPAWNAIVKEFKDNDDVVFGDVNLRADPVRRIHDNDIPVGSGGWPFMMYVIVVSALLNISNEQ